jgi:FkbM family methyltransferase
MTGRVQRVSGARQALERTLDRIFPKRPVYLPTGLREQLKLDPLRIVDVGGALGPDARWSGLGLDLCRFLTFEPDKRSFASLRLDKTSHNTTLPLGVSDSPANKTLYLTAGAFASSFYPPNAAVLKDFAIWPWHESRGTETIWCDTLDNCLAGMSDWQPDFLKIDVEGADLDVLKGARRSIENVLGVQVEVAFVERNLGAPLQPDIDRWLRTMGFLPHQLIREHWVRTNGTFGATSCPQLIWADALYLRPREYILDRLGRSEGRARVGLLARLLAILLSYGAHDYALELVEAAGSARLIETPLLQEAREAVRGSVVSIPLYVLRGSLALSLAIFAWLLLLLARPGRGVGGSIVARQAGPLLHALYRSAKRSGLQRSCISD